VQSRVPGTVLFVGRFDNHKGADIAIGRSREFARRSRRRA
jgi:hypothetical protein